MPRPNRDTSVRIEPDVTIIVRLPHSEADLMAGVLDAVMVEITKKNGLASRGVEPVPGERAEAISKWLKKLVMAFE